jgi:hypothetical protein
MTDVADASVARVPFMITRVMKAALRERGYSDADIEQPRTRSSVMAPRPRQGRLSPKSPSPRLTARPASSSLAPMVSIPDVGEAG